MVFVEGGNFTRELYDNPVQTVFVDSFYIGVYEVTIKQFREYIKETKGDSKYLTDEYFLSFYKDPWDTSAPGYQIDEQMPIFAINYIDAIIYCNWLSRKEGLQEAYEIKWEQVNWNRNANGYRLPTEAEWQYATTAGWKDKEILSINLEILSEYGLIYDNLTKLDQIPIKQPQIVGLKKPNTLGLYDVIGNVREWCWDLFHIDYYSKMTDYNNPVGPEKGYNPYSEDMDNTRDRVACGGDVGSRIKRGNPILERTGIDPLIGSFGSPVGFRVVRNPK
jgi:formylglycine-generating enzyme required for sulfatase activity